jgi:hypothetical protein
VSAHILDLLARGVRIIVLFLARHRILAEQEMGRLFGSLVRVGCIVVLDAQCH